jgi:ribosome-dependent ATPase
MTAYAAVFDAVSHRYGKATALDGVSVAIPAGCIAGLIGPDGVGKSTLLGLLSGVKRLRSGRIKALGGDMGSARHRRDCRVRIAYMPQGLGRNLYPTLSVVENLDFFGRLFGQPASERRARTGDLLVSTGLDPYPDRPAGKLSGGMKQKLALCCALIHEPDLLILDEPTTGVDPLSRRQFWELIGRMRVGRPGMSVVVASADMDEAAQFDWLAAMNAGRLIATGSPAEILSQTHADSLEEAFIALLPEAQRQGHKALVIPPRVPRPGPPAIEATGLTMRFGGFTAVDHVSFRIETGEIFGFLGSNGCGKSTTMKMLTGLLPPSEGTATLFGQPVDAHDLQTRKRIGYMSQSFSLYGELTVRQNLVLDAQLFDLPGAGPRIAELMEHYGLATFADSRPDSLPLGIRQRLQLAVAVLHRPGILILDEPTSGVDPVERDRFWQSLIDMSRRDGVTIFISTHFMNEAARCDRISAMNAGKVLAEGRPEDLIRARGAHTLEDAFIGYLEDAAGQPRNEQLAPARAAARAAGRPNRLFDPGRCWAYALRETMELRRDRMRLAFALLGPIVMMITFGFGISFDVKHLAYAAFDQDQSLQSRTLLQSFEGSRYFLAAAPVTDKAQMQRRLITGELALVVEVPPDFGRDLLNARTPELGIWLDGAMPFRAETTRGYVTGLMLQYFNELSVGSTGQTAQLASVNVAVRFVYNPDFLSVFAIVPGVIMLMLVLIPAMMTAVSVVQEKESGSIANFRRHLSPGWSSCSASRHLMWWWHSRASCRWR